MKHIFLVLATISLLSCLEKNQSEQKATISATCPGGIGARKGADPIITVPQDKGQLIVCGYLEEKKSPTSYVMSEFDIYIHNDSDYQGLLQLGAIHERLIDVQPDKSLKLTQQIYSKPKRTNLFEQVISCKSGQCQLSDKKCVIKKDLPRYRKPIVLVKNLKALLAEEEGQFKVFMAALHGYGPANKAFQGNWPSGIDGAVAENYEQRRKLLLQVSQYCK